MTSVVEKFKKLFLVLFIFNWDRTNAATVADSWILFAKSFKDSWSNCSSTIGTFECLKESSLDVFDKVVESDIIPLTADARLVRSDYYSRKVSFYSDANIHNNVWERRRVPGESWTEHFLVKLFGLFQSHTLNIDIIPKSTGRERHRHRNQMLPMMSFGMTAVGLVIVPIGFQFLAVLAGKALLLSKMALLLAAINGLKKVATSGVHYGLYHTGPHHHWDRGDADHPRFINTLNNK